MKIIHSEKGGQIIMKKSSGTDEAIKMIKKDKEITGAMVALGGIRHQIETGRD